MPSNSLWRWQSDRVPRLNALEGRIAAAAPFVLTDENLRALVAMVCAHFQGFCRDLYIESTAAVVRALTGPLGTVAQSQFMAQIGLGTGNPNLQTLTRDFDRFGLNLKAEPDADPANALRLNHLAVLIQWRNFVVHHGVVPPAGPPLALAVALVWRGSCDGLASELDRIVYDYLRVALGAPPW